MNSGTIRGAVTTPDDFFHATCTIAVKSFRGSFMRRVSDATDGDVNNKKEDDGGRIDNGQMGPMQNANEIMAGQGEAGVVRCKGCMSCVHIRQAGA